MTAFSDFEGDLKAWLVTEPDLSALIAGRVYFSIPSLPVFPLVRLYRSGGGVQPGEAPERDIRVSFEVWGGQPSDYPAVRAVSTLLESLFHDADNVVLNGSTLLQFARVSAVIDSPDPDTGWPRRVVDALCTVRST